MRHLGELNATFRFWGWAKQAIPSVLYPWEHHACHLCILQLYCAFFPFHRCKCDIFLLTLHKLQY